MEPHVITLPRKVVIGYNVIGHLPKYLKELTKGRPARVLMVTGPNVYAMLGKNLAEALQDKGFDVHVKTVSSATLEVARSIAEEVRSDRLNGVIGFGGGKPIDVAKYVASQTGLWLASIPTAASHDGIASPFVSLKGDVRPTSSYAKEPDLIIADISVISSAPRRVNIAGVGDIVAKFTAVLDWRLAHRLRGEYYGGYAASLALMSAKHVLASHRELAKGGMEGLRVLVEALISSGVAMCIAGSTRPASGSEHLFSHALDVIAPKPALHGEQTGVGTIMMLYLHGRRMWRRVRAMLKSVGAPVTAKELGISDYYIVKALTIAHRIRPERYTILGTKGLTWEAAEKIAVTTGVIS